MEGDGAGIRHEHSDDIAGTAPHHRRDLHPHSSGGIFAPASRNTGTPRRSLGANGGRSKHRPHGPRVRAYLHTSLSQPRHGVAPEPDKPT